MIDRKKITTSTMPRMATTARTTRSIDQPLMTTGMPPVRTAASMIVGDGIEMRAVSMPSLGGATGLTGTAPDIPAYPLWPPGRSRGRRCGALLGPPSRSED